MEYLSNILKELNCFDEVIEEIKSTGNIDFLKEESIEYNKDKFKFIAKINFIREVFNWQGSKKGFSYWKTIDDKFRNKYYDLLNSKYLLSDCKFMINDIYELAYLDCTKTNLSVKYNKFKGNKNG